MAALAGEDRSVGHAQDNYLGFEAHHDTDAGSGSLFIYWPNAPGGRPGCFANTSWPALDTITVLGLPSIKASSLSVLVGNPPSVGISIQQPIVWMTELPAMQGFPCVLLRSTQQWRLLGHRVSAVHGTKYRLLRDIVQDTHLHCLVQESVSSHMNDPAYMFIDVSQQSEVQTAAHNSSYLPATQELTISGDCHTWSVAVRLLPSRLHLAMHRP